MEFLTDFTESARTFLPLLVTLAIVVVVLGVTNRVLDRRWRNNPDAQFRFQLIMLVLTLVGVLAIVVTLPIDESLRNQLLSLIGVLLSAAIALSSTTFIGNILAGIMLKAIRSARPGDFITIGDLTGRITEMDLLHTEVQTEFRDLVTVPNLTMVTQPLQVVRASGTIVTAEVSLGYDLPQATVREHLCRAAEATGLKDAFAHVRELGDFSVTYRVAGLLEDVQSLISARAALRASVLDTLHAAGIEIMSPNFMVTRASSPEARVIPPVQPRGETEEKRPPEEIAFDKAAEAASIEELRDAIERIDEQLSAETGTLDDATRTRLEATKVRLGEQIAAAEERIKAEKAAR
jgi:small-conductance mechanosensitive channel